MIILFDIDNTLIDTNTLKKYFAQHIIKLCNINLSSYHDFEKSYIQKIKGSNNIDIYHYIKNIEKRFNCSSKELEKLFIKNEKIYHSVVYNEVEELLTKLKMRHTLGIYSEGNYNFQITKLRNSDLLGYFSKDYIYIFNNKLDKESVSKLPRQAVIVDDKKDVIDQLHRLHFQTIHLTDHRNYKSIFIRLF
jgi:FMN phosphatase YigB (HAD superfamily)